MRYFSVCSGVEAASLAWMPLGWEAFAFSEIDPFPCAVLAERFPSVPNLGDMTKISIQENGDIHYGADASIPDDGRPIDLIVGGTPCQDASVAGKRAGLVDGSRSKLAFTFTRLAYELAAYRGLRWIVWENVPGVFSLNKGWDFAMFLSFIAGRFVKPPKDGWGTFGIVPEGSRGNFGLCWRVLDVQYVRVDGFPRAIPQRRRRCFLVGYIGDWRRAAEVLFEPKSLLGDYPPKRSKRQAVAENAGGCVEKADGCLKMISVETGHGFYSQTDYAGTIESNEDQHRRNIVVSLIGDRANKTDFTPIVASFMGGQGSKAGGIGYEENVSSTIKAAPSGSNQVPDIVCVHGSQDPISNTEHANAVNRNNGLENCVAIPINSMVIGKDIKEGDRQTTGIGKEGDPCPTIQTEHHHVVASHLSVRRLLPIETERLMGFPDNWTKIPWRGKPAEECPDTPRYKACGNSMGVNCMRWIGLGIEMVEKNHKKE